jgi:4-hydroxy-3-polyprenylbenzoate decarboxylase
MVERRFDMGLRSTRQVVEDLRTHGRLIEVLDPVDPHLELAEIHRRVYCNGGPALLFSNVQGCRFPVVSNLFSTLEQAKFIFRRTFDSVQLAVQLKVDPRNAWRHTTKLPSLLKTAWTMRPKFVTRGPVQFERCTLADLPHVTCWPDDGGAFITLPQVLSQTPAVSGKKQPLSEINLGMYRVQLDGNNYQNQECGLHYQLHRGIGVHHARALAMQLPFPVNVSVGGSPAMTLSAVMPLPEGMSELIFAGALAGHRIPLIRSSAPIYADADFCIVGEVQPNVLKPEGPFGDHLGYYARVHDFPVLSAQQVWHRRDAIWPMTVVGRPPQEDTTFGQLIHELTGPVVPTVLPGVKGVHAVDAAGVHPLLLAIGSERYTPYAKPNRPQELLTQASAILGQGQLSLAKYLWITEQVEGADLDIENVSQFFQYCLRRVDWRRDLHFHTRTTIDTLDYSGGQLNQGSKLVIAAAGEVRRELPCTIESGLKLPETWRDPCIALPVVLVVSGNAYTSLSEQSQLWQVCDRLEKEHPLNHYPLIVVADDSRFAARNIDNFVWTTFTRSNPATDVYGIAAWIQDKHFGCDGSLVIDARTKPHHAPPLVEDPKVSARVDARAARGGPLAQYL